MKKIGLFVFIILSTVNVFAQKEDNNWHFLRFGYQAGKVLQTHEFLKGENATGKPIDYFQSFRLEYGVQTDGSSDWHHVFNLPTYGIGIYTVNFFDDSELGTPSAIYGFFNWPFKRYKHSALSAEFGFGIAYDWQPFEPEKNPYNLVIGMGRSVYIDVGLKYSYYLTKHFNLSGQFSFSHFSNGSTQQPNAGINLLAPRINLAYNFGGRNHLPTIKKMPEYTAHKKEFTVSLTYGSKSEVFTVKNMPRDDTTFTNKRRESFNIFALIFAWNKQIYYNSKVGLTAEVEYDPSLKVSYSNENGEVIRYEGETKDKIRAGFTAQYLLVINKIEGKVGLGYYVYGKNPGSLPKLYQRLGIKFYILRDLFMGLNLRFYDFSKADNMEYHIGYRFDL